MSWKTFFQRKNSKLEFFVTFFLLIILMLFFSQFIGYIEQREGIVLNDPLLNTFHPINLTWLTFALIYLSIILFLFNVIRDPNKILIALQTYGLMVIFRVIAMYLTPFNAPEKIILLDDPFVQIFGKGDILTKDLFFSGHTGTLFLLFLLTENKKLKFTFLISTILVGSAVLLQHVHYSVDVFIAPFVAYSAYKIIKNLHSESNRENR